MVINVPEIQETQFPSLGQEDPISMYIMKLASLKNRWLKHLNHVMMFFTCKFLLFFANCCIIFFLKVHFIRHFSCFRNKKLAKGMLA